MAKRLRAGIIGASGYTGADLVRLLATHPQAQATLLAAGRKAGQALGETLPNFAPLSRAPLLDADRIDWAEAELDLVFLGLPHGMSQALAARIQAARPDLKIIDLSADFRLRDPQTYEQWYGAPHQALALQTDAVYGLSEWARAHLPGAPLVACPGCYPTAALLALLPVIDLIDPDDIAIDAKSGVSGAGRGLKDQLLFCEVAEAMHPYALGGHRHMPEIEQELAARIGRELKVGFTPHLIPINRGELLTIYVHLGQGRSVADLRDALDRRYRDEAFVHLLPEGEAPATRMVRGSNHCVLNLFADRRPGRAILSVAIDNLVKGSSGQAVQNMNLIFGLPETMGLAAPALFP